MPNQLTTLQEILRRNQEAGELGIDIEQDELDEAALAQQQADLDPDAEPIPEPMDPAFKAALEKRDKMQKSGQLLSAFQNIISGTTGATNDQTVAKSLMKQGGQAVDDYKTVQATKSAAKKEGRASEKHDLEQEFKQIQIGNKTFEFMNLKKTTDPASDESKFAQDLFMKYKTDLGEQVDETGVRRLSAKDLHDNNEHIRKRLADMLKMKATDVRAAAERTARSDESEKGRQFTMSENEKDRTYKQSEIDRKKAEMLEKEKRAEERKIATETRKEKTVDAKEKNVVKKENRKTRRELDKAEKTTQETIKELESIDKQFEEYSRTSPGGTGPIATAFGLTKYASEKTQALDARFKLTGLKQMVKMFAGLSKAIDSDAERRAFEATQLDLKNDDNVNRQIIRDKLNAAKALLTKTQNAKRNFDKYGDFTDSPESTESGKTVVKKGYNASTNQTQLIYSDGSKEVVEGKR